ncbi:MAG: PH domain-containing protein [Chloroflexota bacterium]|nr:PH domain-containing protein [Chloroflexota bacterium]
MTSSESNPGVDDEREQAVPAANEPAEGDEWRQAHWAFIVIGALRYLRGFIVPFAIAAFTQGFNDSRADYFWYGFAAIAGIGSVAASLAQWWMYRYRLTDRDITLKSGIISKQDRVILFERIQSVNLSDAPLERLFQVMKLQVETGAGGGANSEIELQALKRDEAAALRAQLIAARQRLRSEDGAAPALSTLEGDITSDTVVPDRIDSEGELVRKLSNRELLIAGATSGRIGAAVAIAGVLAQFGDDLIPTSVWERMPWEGVADAATNVQVVASLLVALGLLAWFISIVATVLTYGGFELRRVEDQLQVQYGLLDRKRTTIPIRRIQAIRIVEGLLRQPFGYAEVRFDSAGFGADQGASGVLSPLLPTREVLAFLRDACPQFAADPDPAGLRSLPERARRRYIVAASIGWVITITIAAAIVWRFLDFPVWWVLTALVVTPLFAIFGNLRYRDAGWLVADGAFLLRWRAMSRVTVLTQARRLQYRGLRADPFQRRAKLVTFRTAVASGGSREGFSLPHLDAQDGEALIEQLGRRQRTVNDQRSRARRSMPIDIDLGIV